MVALATPTNSSAPPQTHRVSGQGRNVSDEGVKRAVSQRVWPLCHRGDSGTASIAAPEDSTTRAAKDGPVWFHCSAPAVRYEGKCGADSARANHSENEPSMKGLKTYIGIHHSFSCTCSITLSQICWVQHLLCMFFSCSMNLYAMLLRFHSYTFLLGQSCVLHGWSHIIYIIVYGHSPYPTALMDIVTKKI